MTDEATVEMTAETPESTEVDITATDLPESAEVEEAGEATTPDGEDTTAKPKGVQKRIDELTSNWRNTERDRDHWRELAMQHMQSQQEPEQPQATGEPQLESFDDYEQYIVAKAKYEITQEQERLAQQQRDAEQQAQYKEAVGSFQQRSNEARAKYADYDAVALNPSVPINETMEQVILGSEKGPDVAYYLGSNPQEAAKISQMTPVMAAMEMGKIEVKLSAPPKPSGAPEPIQTVGSGGSQAKDPEQMSTAEWIKHRNKQLGR